MVNRIGFQILTTICFLLHIFVDGSYSTEVYTLKFWPSDGRIVGKLAATFEYPEVHFHTLARAVEQRGLLGRTRSGSMSRHVPPRPLNTSNAASVLYTTRCFSTPGEDMKRLIHIVPLSVFASAADAFGLGSADTSPPMV